MTKTSTQGARDSSPEPVPSPDPASEYAKRRVALRRRLNGAALYVSAMPNIRYLTGFTGSAGHVLVGPEKTILYTDSRYGTQASEQTSGIEVRVSFKETLVAMAADVRKMGLRKLFFEWNRLSFASYAYLSRLRHFCPLVPRPYEVERLRSRKSEAEVEAIRRSAAINSEAFEDACSAYRKSWTEERFALEIDYAMRKRGAEGCAFPTIVASGTHSALPHAEPRRAKLQRNGLTIVDQGAIIGGYCSDMTRMVALGQPDMKQQKLYEAVLEAHLAAIEAIRPGVECRTVDAAARRVLRKKSVDGMRLDKMFVHSAGHGVGLEVHEGPTIAPKERRKLSAGMVVTVEPGIYWEGFAGVRLEDLVVVREGGCEVLTDNPKTLRVLG